MFQAIIFDRDGVIIDSEGVNRQAAVQAFSHWSGVKLTEDDKHYVIARHPVDYGLALRQKYHLPDTLSDQDFLLLCNDIYSSLMEDIAFIEPAVDCIRRLQRAGCRLALNTSSYLQQTLSLLQQKNLADCFEVVTSYDDKCAKKPDPASYLLTAQKLWLSPSECVAIEDSSFGLQAAKAAGMTCVIIPTLSTKDQDFSLADSIVDSADEITIPFLESLRGTNQSM